MALEFNYPLGGLKGAEYNPRAITDDAIAKLCRSLDRFGVVKPIIVRGDTIVAGHQRTRALRKLGVKTAPVYVLEAGTTIYDEVRFNQLHNGTDLDGDASVRIPPGELGYGKVPHQEIDGDLRSSLAVVREQICQMIGKYGPWGGCVATQSGEVIHCQQYALACKIAAVPLLVYRIPDEDRDVFLGFSKFEYGRFSYEGTERLDFLQSFAQMMRLRKGKRTMHSVLYESLVLPALASGEVSGRGLDFGSGQGDYAQMLRRRGVDVHDVELFRRLRGRDAINVRAIRKMIDRLCEDISSGGYDWVVCDSVFNSVNSPEAERAVAEFIATCTKLGGTVFFSGRPARWLNQRAKTTRSADKRRGIEFLDDNGFTALYRKGGWFFQKYHTPEQVEQLADVAGLDLLANIHRTETSWQAKAIKRQMLPIERAVSAASFEFEMLWPDGSRIGRSGDVIAAIRRMYGE